MSRQRSLQTLLDLFNNKAVVDLAAIRSALDDVSVPTTFRYLQLISYRRSYNHNGRYYTLFDPSRFDRGGLWSYQGIHFSVDGSLKNTVRRLVHESPMGATHRELQQTLQLRVHNTLLELWSTNEITREALAGFFVYLHAETKLRQAQISLRQAQLTAKQIETEVTDAIVIEVLLVLIRYPGAKLAEVVKRLRGHAPPITTEHVRVVLHRYDLDHFGEKRGRSPP